MTIAADPVVVRRPWWETGWCVALALLLVAVPLLWPAVPPLDGVPGLIAHAHAHDGGTGIDLLVAGIVRLIGVASAVKAIVVAIPVIAAAGMLWLSRVAHGRVQPSAYFALPFAYAPAFLHGAPGIALAMALALGSLALWLALAARPGVRAGVFVVVATAIWVVHPLGWLCLVVTVCCGEGVRARVVETDDVRRGWIASVARGVVSGLPLAPPVLLLVGQPIGAIGWPAGPAVKAGWLVGALRDQWAVFDVASVALVAFVIWRGWRDHRLVHAPMLVAATFGLLVLLLAAPAGADGGDMGLAPGVFVLALLSIRFNARVKQFRRAEVAWAAWTFLVARIVAATASAVIGSAGGAHDLAAPTAMRSDHGDARFALPRSALRR